jgi:hypothetical protein
MAEAVQGLRGSRLVRPARRPQCSPHATPRDVIRKIFYLRQNYHFGPGKIADYLKRFHHRDRRFLSPSHLDGMNRLPANQKHRPHAKRWLRNEKPSPVIACRWT